MGFFVVVAIVVVVVEFVVLLVLVWLWFCGLVVGLWFWIFFLSGGKEGRVRDQGGFRMQASKLASKKEGLEGLKCSCPSQAWEMSEDEFLWKRQGKKDAIA